MTGVEIRALLRVLCEFERSVPGQQAREGSSNLREIIDKMMIQPHMA
jgi:hypothetical protein